MDQLFPSLLFRDLVAPGQSLNSLLMKFARSSTDVTGVKVYNSKKPTWKPLTPELCYTVNSQKLIRQVKFHIQELSIQLMMNICLLYWSHGVGSYHLSNPTLNSLYCSADTSMRWALVLELVNPSASSLEIVNYTGNWSNVAYKYSQRLPLMFPQRNPLYKNTAKQLSSLWASTPNYSP